MLFALALSAFAADDDFEFSSDRPGVGDSTLTPGPGHVILEAGVAAGIAPGTVSMGTQSLTGRVGVGRFTEIRLRVPDIFFDGAIGYTSVGVGAKFGGAFGSDDMLSASVVPELFKDVQGNGLGAGLNGNFAVDLEGWGFWAHVGSSFRNGGAPVGLVAGGGISIDMGDVGSLFANSGAVVDGNPFIGGGVAIMLDDAVQLDIDMDVFLAGENTAFVPMLGGVVGF